MNAIQPLHRPPLHERLLAFPENPPAKSSAASYTRNRAPPDHAESGSVLGMRIGLPYRLGEGGPGGWWILDEPEIHFVRDTVVAVSGLAGWRRERMPAIPGDHRFEVVPDWVCEILSPSTAKKDRTQKLPLYGKYGAAYAWLVDPLARTLEAFALREEGWLLIATLKDDDPVSVPPFDAISFSLADLWA